jgi:hypothetical protein
MLRMRRAPFYELVKTFRERGLLEDSIHTYVEEHVAMFLYVVGHNKRFRVMHKTCRRSIKTISRYFNQVLYAIRELKQQMIKPSSGETPSKYETAKDGIHTSFCSLFCNSTIHTSLTVYLLLSSQDCIGAIDGTYVSTRVPKSQSAAYRGRKHYTSQNVLVFVDFDLKFTYVLASWLGRISP